MKAYLRLKCYGCDAVLDNALVVDTADMPDELQAKINKVLLNHRKNCRYYKVEVVK